MDLFSTFDLVENIRLYQSRNPILRQQSHHFVFDCPFNPAINSKPDFIWIGLNPGHDEHDWIKTNHQNDEETRYRDFQVVFGRSRGSKT